MRYTVYADINCPFCFALNERFNAMGLAEEVDWRSIQHAPHITSASYSFESLSELTAEVMEVRRRVPTLNIVTPPFRPGTAFASKIITEASVVAPRQAIHLRTLVYQALWRFGQDISDPGIIEQLLAQAGINDLVISDSSRRKLLAWQQEWQDGGFERNIPVTLSSSGNSLIGFPIQVEQDSFFSHDMGLDITLSTICSMAPRQKILLLDRNREDIHSFIEHMGKYDIVVAKTLSALEETLNSNGDADIVVLDLDTLGEDWDKTCHRLRKTTEFRERSIVISTKDSGAEIEAAAFQAGASELLRKPFHPIVIKARLGKQLEMIRSIRVLENMARIDSLTEVHNRRQFDISLQSEWQRCRRAGTPLSLLIIDIDFFKNFNDQYGHDRGDDCLRSVAGLLCDALQRPDDMLARYGGEEFAVILGATDYDGAAFLAERCRTQIALANIPHRFSNVTDKVTVSIGHATICPADGTHPEQLIRAADQALYEAKAMGRNCAIGVADGGANSTLSRFHI
ncbi:MAG: diguanylate cyclase [Thiogranum sp.]